MASFAEKVEKHRKELKLTQEEFAEKIGVSRNTVMSWESGLRHPHIKRVEKIADVLVVTEKYLVDDNETDPQAGAGDQAYIREIRRKFNIRSAKEAAKQADEVHTMYAGGENFAFSPKEYEMMRKVFYEMFMAAKEAAREAYTPKKVINMKKAAAKFEKKKADDDKKDK